MTCYCGTSGRRHSSNGRSPNVTAPGGDSCTSRSLSRWAHSHVDRRLCRARRRAPDWCATASAHDFGRVLEGDGLKHVFTLTNAGTSPAHITRVERSPSCVAGMVPPSIAPGASAGVEIDCASRGRAGKLADFVAVHSDDPSSPFRLQLRATIEPRLAFETDMIEIEVAPGERRSREIRLVGPLATRARIAVRSIDAGGPAAAILPAQGDRPAGLALTLLGDKVGVRVGRVLVSTGLDQPEELGLPYTMKVTGNVRVSPTNPTFNLRDPEARLQTLIVTSARADFRSALGRRRRRPLRGRRRTRGGRGRRLRGSRFRRRGARRPGGTRCHGQAGAG